MLSLWHSLQRVLPNSVVRAMEEQDAAESRELFVDEGEERLTGKGPTTPTQPCSSAIHIITILSNNSDTPHQIRYRSGGATSLFAHARLVAPGTTHW